MKVRTHSLIVGPTGVGKTEVVRRFAEEMGLGMITIACNSWVPWGAATQPSSLTTIAAFLGSEARTHKMLYLDEIDKTVPISSAYGSSWALGVFGEVLALLDGDGRLKGCGWTDEHIARLANTFIVGAGAFQQLATQQKDEVAAASRPQVGFAIGDPVELEVPHYSRKVNGQGLPPEIASRFAADVVMIEPPTEEEYARGIIQIHSAFKGKGKKITGSEIQRLAKAAGASDQGMRWFESYCLGLAASAVEKDIPLLKPFRLTRSPSPATPGAVDAPAATPDKNGAPWIKGASGSKSPSQKPDSLSAQLLAAANAPTPSPVPHPQEAQPPKPATPPVHGAGPNTPAKPAGWAPAIVATQNPTLVRRAALKACSSLRSLLWHARVKEILLENGENALYGKPTQAAPDGGLVCLLRCIAWSLEEYWNPKVSQDDLFGHESNFGLIAGLLIQLEVEIALCQSEYAEAGLGERMLHAIASLRDFAVEWALWNPKSEAPEEFEW
ncbi:MAG: AAA family ATPase [Candidatus Methylacidiphilales bacterium]|nr:AAA family ATPase [Candidatus Methylacidiphilales bacterium]